MPVHPGIVSIGEGVSHRIDIQFCKLNINVSSGDQVWPSNHTVSDPQTDGSYQKDSRCLLFNVLYAFVYSSYGMTSCECVCTSAIFDVM